MPILIGSLLSPPLSPPPQPTATPPTIVTRATLSHTLAVGLCPMNLRITYLPVRRRSPGWGIASRLSSPTQPEGATKSCKRLLQSCATYTSAGTKSTRGRASDYRAARSALRDHPGGEAV